MKVLKLDDLRPDAEQAMSVAYNYLTGDAATEPLGHHGGRNIHRLDTMGLSKHEVYERAEASDLEWFAEQVVLFYPKIPKSLRTWVRKDGLPKSKQGGRSRKGKTRPIDDGAEMKRLVCTFIVDRLADRIEAKLTKRQFGGRPWSRVEQACNVNGATVLDHTATAIWRINREGYPWCCLLDLEDAYGCVPKQAAIKALMGLGMAKDAARWTWRLVRIDAVDSRNRSRNFTRIGQGIEQGNVLSAMLMNLVLAPTIKYVEKKLDVKIVAYLDDLYFLARNQATTRGAFRMFRDHAESRLFKNVRRLERLGDAEDNKFSRIIDANVEPILVLKTYLVEPLGISLAPEKVMELLEWSKAVGIDAKKFPVPAIRHGVLRWWRSCGRQPAPEAHGVVDKFRYKAVTKTAMRARTELLVPSDRKLQNPSKGRPRRLRREGGPLEGHGGVCIRVLGNTQGDENLTYLSERPFAVEEQGRGVTHVDVAEIRNQEADGLLKVSSWKLDDRSSTGTSTYKEVALYVHQYERRPRIFPGAHRHQVGQQRPDDQALNKGGHGPSSRGLGRDEGTIVILAGHPTVLAALKGEATLPRGAVLDLVGIESTLGDDPRAIRSALCKLWKMVRLDHQVWFRVDLGAAWTASQGMLGDQHDRSFRRPRSETLPDGTTLLLLCSRRPRTEARAAPPPPSNGVVVTKLKRRRRNPNRVEAKLIEGGVTQQVVVDAPAPHSYIRAVAAIAQRFPADTLVLRNAGSIRNLGLTLQVRPSNCAFAVAHAALSTARSWEQRQGWLVGTRR